MKIAFITGWFPTKNTGSGASLFIQELKNGLIKKGVDVELITPQFSSLKSYHLATLGRIFKNIFLAITSIKNYNLIVCFDYDGFALINNQKIPIICCPRGILKEVAGTEYGSYKIFLKLQAFFEQINLNRSNYVIVPSFYAKKSIQKYYKTPEEKISVIYNGINITKWLNGGKNIAKKSDSKIRILAVGKMYPRKNFPLLLKMFDILYKNLPQVELHIVGDGIEFDIVSKLKNTLDSKEGIKLYGFVEDLIFLKNIYKQCDLFCHLSEQETFGNVILEAMANGKPVIALNKASIPEIVQDNYNGIIIDTLNPFDIANKIQLLIMQPEKMTSLGQQAFKTAQLFSQQKTVENFYNKFLEILK